MAVSDEGARTLKPYIRQNIMSTLGSKEIMNLGYRQPWAFIGHTKGVNYPT